MSDDQTVGYRRPPIHSRFKPGRSGNPKGRPKGSKNLRTLVTQELDQKIAVRTEQGTRKVTKREAIGMRLAHKAMEGDPRAIATIIALDRAGDAPSAEARSIADDLEILRAYARDWSSDDRS
ncbi:MAG: DUF5681 domain-containing protein [Alphaproteobacteria bacterium]